MNWKQTYEEWLTHASLEEQLKTQLTAMKDDKKALEESFYTSLKFGTAGMRGIMGPGINRMNIYTVRQASEGLARLIEQTGEEAKKRGVAIAYDSRHQSAEFALEAAKTLGYHGIQTYLFESLRPTPELSFAVRHFQAAAGIMITASHNPPAYNGYKVYGEDGGQMPPEPAEKLTELVLSVENPLDIEVADENELKEAGLLKVIGEEVDQAYLKEMEAVTQDSELVQRMKDKVTIVFSPLHGTGKMIGERALKNAGFENVLLVSEQADPDPEFSTVSSPNPEEPGAFEYAVRLGKETDADVLIATDPDADRLGMAVKKTDGTYEVLSGNQIAALMLDYLLTIQKQKGTLSSDSVVVKSVVSSELPAVIAESYGLKTENVLTGFKFIAEKIGQYEQAEKESFLFGFEESYGYLIEPFVRDKDAIQALVLASELTAFHKEQNRTVYEALQNLFETHGYFIEKTLSVELPGIEGSAKIKALMESLQENPPTDFAGIDVTTREDYEKGVRITENGPIETMDFPSASVLRFLLEDGSWIAIRPSGTEPKIKFYIGVKGTTQEEAAEKLSIFEQEIQAIVA